ncbi:MAG: KamA family protein [Bacteroidales bacterium]|nr:KamA family protein [Bacteroidales bacterium]
MQQTIIKALKYKNRSSARSNILSRLLEENPVLHSILKESPTSEDAISSIYNHILTRVKNNPVAHKVYRYQLTGERMFNHLDWEDFAAIRILDYIDHTGKTFIDKNRNNRSFINNPFAILWKEANGIKTKANLYFFIDMLQMFRQLNGGRLGEMPSKEKLEEWMERHPSGLDERIIKLRETNRKRIIDLFIRKMDDGEIKDAKFRFKEGMSYDEKIELMEQWWTQRVFHLRFAIRSPELLEEMLDYTLSSETMEVLYQAKNAGIPFFVNPHYLSLLNVHEPEELHNTDQVIRDYIVYSKELVEEFGQIEAWEKEDIVEPGEPNAAGWLLPRGHNIHRRYPEVAILIPDSMGRACGGLCSSCQRMYDFQSGHLNFDLDRLKPKETWDEKLQRLLRYFENDAQLRDILITGGDALMSSDRTLRKILESVYEMALRKKEANQYRANGDKYAEMVRIRLGTRLPVYLPHRIDDKLALILANFKEKAKKIGISQFVIQTHFESAMEITPESKTAIEKLIAAGWTVTNQQVFTAAASRRGHAAKLRKTLNDIGVLTYYTFTVKGFMENHHNFAPNARSVQEQVEEKSKGAIPQQALDSIRSFPAKAERMKKNIDEVRKEQDLPFLATDRNVLNMPGVGKSLTFRTIGITPDGRRILKFDHDPTRFHSPIIHKMGKVTIVESKSIAEYLEQVASYGDNMEDYANLYGYSIGETQTRMPVYEYPEYDFRITEELTNLEIE